MESFSSVGRRQHRELGWGNDGTEKGRATSLGSMQPAALRDGVQTAKKTAGKRERGRSMIFAYGRDREGDGEGECLRYPYNEGVGVSIKAHGPI